MQVENKPLESDSSTDDTFENLDDIFEEASGEESSEDVATAPKSLTVEQLQTLTGRKDITSIEAFEKHYTNLKSFVGKKTEPKTVPEPKQTQEVPSEFRQILENQQKIEFLMDTPEAKTHFEEYVKPYAKGQDISYAQAWEKIQPLISGSEAKEREKQVGINSKNRVAPIDNTKLKSLEDNARSGSPDAQEAYIAALLGKK
jgi:hypothetical protein